MSHHITDEERQRWARGEIPDFNAFACEALGVVPRSYEYFSTGDSEHNRLMEPRVKRVREALAFVYGLGVGQGGGK